MQAENLEAHCEKTWKENVHISSHFHCITCKDLNQKCINYNVLNSQASDVEIDQQLNAFNNSNKKVFGKITAHKCFVYICEYMHNLLVLSKILEAKCDHLGAVWSPV